MFASRRWCCTWCPWHAREFGQVLGLADHDLDAVGRRLVLEQDEELAEGSWGADGHPPTAQGFLGTHALKRREERREGKRRLVDTRMFL